MVRHVVKSCNRQDKDTDCQEFAFGGKVAETGDWRNTWGRKGVVDDSIPAGAGETTTSTFSLPAELIGIDKVFFRVVPN
tara:strand:- start:232 stop:468 length:237 start_codon:yes stop_codon:yes gene_type:complete